MKLTINNIGKIKEAEIEINGITVITGENDTGKSTVGKILWSIFNGFYKIDEKVYKEKVSELIKSVSKIMEKNGYNKFLDNRNDFFGLFDKTEENIALQLLKDKKYYSENEIKFIINKYKKELKIGDISNFTNEINDTLKMENNEIIKEIISRVLSKEFHNQINTVFPENKEKNIGKINFQIKKKNINLKIKNNEIIDCNEYFFINKEVIYIDNPFVLDNCDYDENHQNHLANNVFAENENNIISEIKVKKKLNNIYNKLNNILEGEILENKNFEFVYRKNGEDINLKNLSTGLKTFVIIKMLLQNGTLEENGTIILDEPEIHLHPEWQLKFAELIVLLQKEFGMHILLTTHSPYFVSAIEVFSEKYKIDEKCKYYIAENEGNSSVIKDIADNTREIYRKMARPLQDLENLRYSDYDE